MQDEEGPHAWRLRHGRDSAPFHAYLITTVTAGRARWFSDLRSGRLLVDELRACDADADTITWCFVVMPDHLHWLVQLGARSPDLSRLLNRVKGRSARSINRYLDRRGPVWQQGYHDHAVRRSEDILHLAYYVLENPIRAKLVTRRGDYPLWDACWL